MTKKEEFSKETIDHLSKLALLELSEDEKENLSKQLGDIVNYFKKLDDFEEMITPYLPANRKKIGLKKKGK